MNIRDVIEIAVVGIFSDALLSKKLVLKGGSAMHLLEKVDERMSTDIDFSVQEKLVDSSNFFDHMKKKLEKVYRGYKYDVIDFKYEPRPKNRGEQPDWWSGWVCTFKLSSLEHRKKSLETRRRLALVPIGANSSKMDIEISEHEYCGNLHKKTIRGVKICGYSRVSLIVEKIRALCQQHPSYEYLTTKRNRSRDLVDIYNLAQNHVNADFINECREVLPDIFQAKYVDLKLLEIFWEDDFVAVLENGFTEVRDTMDNRCYPFGTYLEYIRALVKQIQ